MSKHSNEQQIGNIPIGVEKQRLSKIYLLVGLIKGIKSAIIPVVIIFAGSLFGGESINEEWFSFGSFSFTRLHFFASILLLGLIIAIISLLIQYFCTFWFLTDTEVVLCKGLLNKKITRMPIEKIHSINTNESLIERVFSVVSVKIDSAGGAATGDIIIPSIKQEAADKLRADIKQKAEKHDSPALTPQENTETNDIKDSLDPTKTGRGYAVDDARQYNLTIWEILLAGLANGRTMLYLFIGVGAIWQIIDTTGFSDYVFSHGSELAQRFVSFGIATIAIVVIVLLLVSWAVSVISFAVKFFNFSIRTEGDRIETHRGLISRINTQISINRIQEIQITQDILARVFGYATIKAEIAAHVAHTDGSDTNGMGTTGVILHPFIKIKEVDGFIAAFIPEYVNRPTELEPLPPAACRRSFFRYIRWTLLFWVAPILACLIFIPSDVFALMSLIKTIAIIVGTAGVIFLMFTAWRAYKGRALAIGDKIIVIKHGAYKTHFAFVPKRKIQMATSKQNPFQRAAKVSHIYIRTAGIGTRTHLLDVSENRAAEFLAWATPISTYRKPLSTLVQNEVEKITKEYVEKSVEYFDLSGIAVGISVGENSPLPCAGMDVEYAFGFSDYDNKIPLDKGEVFHFASVSKLFVATAIMQLSVKGLLNIDERITTYLPDFKMSDERYKEITIRQMLSHTAGMPDVSDYHWSSPKTDNEALKNYVLSKEVTEGHLLHDPSEPTFVYSNMAYETLGLLISEISGESFEDYIANNIFIPLAMRDSTFLTFLRDSQKCKLASPHIKDEEKHIKKLDIYPYNREHAPSSTLTSTVCDIKKWGEAHIMASRSAKNSGLIFSDIPYEIMWNPAAEIPGVGEHIGLGWFIRKQEGYTFYGHEGSDDGFRSSFWICPELSLQIVVLSNYDKAPVKKINKRLFEILCASNPNQDHQ